MTLASLFSEAHMLRLWLVFMSCYCKLKKVILSAVWISYSFVSFGLRFSQVIRDKIMKIMNVLMARLQEMVTNSEDKTLLSVMCLLHDFQIPYLQFSCGRITFARLY